MILRFQGSFYVRLSLFRTNTLFLRYILCMRSCFCNTSGFVEWHVGQTFDYGNAMFWLLSLLFGLSADSSMDWRTRWLLYNRIIFVWTVWWMGQFCHEYFQVLVKCSIFCIMHWTLCDTFNLCNTVYRNRLLSVTITCSLSLILVKRIFSPSSICIKAILWGQKSPKICP